jgi:preprotein translocase subunit YajC
MPLPPLSLALLQISTNPMFASVFMYGAIFAIFYFLLVRPQQQQRKKHEATIQQLKRGDEVVTAGGLVGEVVHIRQLNADAPSQEDRLTIKSGEARVIVERGRIARIVGAGAAAPAAGGGQPRTPSALP